MKQSQVLTAVVLLVASGTVFTPQQASAQTLERERCAIRLSGTLLGKAPDAALLSSTNPQNSVPALLTSPDFNERFARFVNAKFNPDVGEIAAEDAPYFLAKHILENNRPWREMFVGQYEVRRPIGGPANQAEVIVNTNGLGYFRSRAWMLRYAGNELDGYRLVAAYRMINNTLGVTLKAAANTDGVDADGRKGPACAGCHYNNVYGLDLIAKILSKKVVGSGGNISFSAPNEGPQVLLGGVTVSNDKQFVTAMVNSIDFRFNACRLAAEFVYGRAEYKCEGPAFDACMAAFPSNGDIRDAVAAYATHSTFCQ